MSKLNGFVKLAGIIVIVIGVLFGAGWLIKDNAKAIKKLEDKKLDTRLTKLETSFILEIKHINKSLNRIEKGLFE